VRWDRAVPVALAATLLTGCAAWDNVGSCLLDTPEARRQSIKVRPRKGTSLTAPHFSRCRDTACRRMLQASTSCRLRGFSQSLACSAASRRGDTALPNSSTI
jgi:hypothetical protein